MLVWLLSAGNLSLKNCLHWYHSSSFRDTFMSFWEQLNEETVFAILLNLMNAYFLTAVLPQTFRILADNFSRKCLAVQSYWPVSFLNVSFFHKSTAHSMDFGSPWITLGMLKYYCTWVVAIISIDGWDVCAAEIHCPLPLNRTIYQLCYELVSSQVLILTCFSTALNLY